MRSTSTLRQRVLAPIVCTAALALMAAPAAAAQASPAAHRTASAGHVHYASPGAIKNPALRHDLQVIIRWMQAHPGRSIPVYVRLSIHHHAEAPNAAGDPCTSFYGEADVVTGLADVKVAWLQLSTYFCYTGPFYGPWLSTERVTSHSTSQKIGVTTPGQLLGWFYLQNVSGGIQFNCFVASGATNRCSGNHEYDQVEFQDCILHYGCTSTAYPYLDEFEYLSGQFYANPGNVDLI
jgi:hypothetical protein